MAAVQSDPTFQDYRQERRQLDTALMAACDRYFDLSQLFQLYYEKLADDAFARLSGPREIAALDNLCLIGAQTEQAYDALKLELARSPKSRRVYERTQRHLAGLSDQPGQSASDDGR
ncbi:MAG: hypothetical protein KDK24_17170 [Pseudooceanicola sp.]|nr:hypothetical protein [Pseudooceanicola sp.]